jgi:hypothetical protein
MQRTLISLGLLLSAVAAFPSHSAVLRVDSRAIGATQDGATWFTAYRTVQAALDASHDGDALWIGNSYYSENLVIQRANITMKGGFTGSEQTGVPLGDNPTSLTGTGADLPTLSVTASATGFQMTGFTVRNGSRRGAIRCDATGVGIHYNTITENGAAGGDGGGIVCRPGSEVTITHNLITKNKARHGAGIQARGATVSIVNNVIEENAASFDNEGQPDGVGDEGGGIVVLGGTAVIKNNEVAYNTASAMARASAPDTVSARGGGIAVEDADAVITNNTVAFNAVAARAETGGPAGAGSGGGIYLAGSGTLANNIVAFNTVTGTDAGFTAGGLFVSGATPDAVTVAANLFHANTPDGSAAFAGTNGNLSGDPKFVGPGQFFYNFRLQPGSPAIDSGDDAYVMPGDVDQSGQPRILGAHVDMGAYEALPAVPVPSRLYVRPGAGGSGDGKTWGTAMASVTAALSAVAEGGEVWVAAGTYHERITLRNGVTLLGGFAGAETAAAQRDFRANATVLDGDAAGRVVYIPAGVKNATVDGFTVRNGYGDGFLITGAGVWSKGTGTVIANNVIEDNRIAYTEENPSAYGAGVYIGGGSATVRHNQIRRNSITLTRKTNFPQFPEESLAYGGGLYLENAGVTVASNLIAGNSVGVLDARNGQMKPLGAGLYATQVTGLIANNTISGNVASPVHSTTTTPEGGAVYVQAANVGLILANNIVAFNSSGVMQETSQALFYDNDVFGNGTNYGMVNANPPSTANGNISQDPLFADRANGDYRLTAASPAIDAGSGSYVRFETDLDGKPRVVGGRVDMGAYEYAPSAIPLAQAMQALRIAGGLAAAPADISALNVETSGASAGVVDIADAIRLIRAAVGADS